MQSSPQEDQAVIELDTYVQRLRSHDWYYAYSDDYSVYCRGRDQAAELIRMAERLDPDRVIWKQYAPK